MSQCKPGCRQPQAVPCPVTPDGEHVWVPPHRPHCEACGYPDWGWECMVDGCYCQCHDAFFEVLLPLAGKIQHAMEGCAER